MLATRFREASLNPVGTLLPRLEGQAFSTPMLIGTKRLGKGRKYALRALFLTALWLFGAWAAAGALIVRADLANADALVVLAGSSAYVERTRLAAKLFKEGRSPIILLTNDNQRGGWSSPQQRNPFFVESAVAELIGAGVPREAIQVLPQPVLNTYDEAQVLREYARVHSLHSLLIVTSAYHSRRAFWVFCRVFKDSGINVGLEPVAPGSQTPEPAVWWLYPRGWQNVFGEYLKLIYYLAHY